MKPLLQALCLCAVTSTIGHTAVAQPTSSGEDIPACVEIRILRGPYPVRTPPDSIRVSYLGPGRSVERYPELDMQTLEDYDTLAIMSSKDCPLPSIADFYHAAVVEASRLGGDAAYWVYYGTSYITEQTGLVNTDWHVEGHLLRRR